MSIFKNELDSFTADEVFKKSSNNGERNKKKLIEQELKVIMEKVNEIAIETGVTQYTYSSILPPDQFKEISDNIEDELWSRGFEVKDTISERKLYISWNKEKARDTGSKDMNGTCILEGDWIFGHFKTNTFNDREEILGQVYFDKAYGWFCVNPEEGVPLINITGNVLTKEELNRHIATRATEKLNS